MASTNVKYTITFDRESRRLLERIAAALELANAQNKVVVDSFAFNHDALADIVEKEVEDDDALEGR